jgi:hypothetical protein
MFKVRIEADHGLWARGYGGRVKIAECELRILN